MRTAIRAAFAVIALATLLVSPREGSAANAERSYQLQTRIVEQTPSVGAYDGALQLKVSPDGIVSGYYRPNDNPRFVPVTGGLTGDQIWIEIGTFAKRPMRFSGTFRDGKIEAQGNRPIIDGGRYTWLGLTAIPKPI